MPTIDSISTTHPSTDDRGVPPSKRRREPRFARNAAFDRIARRVDRLQREYVVLQACLACLEADFGTLNADSATLRADLATLRADASALRTDVEDSKAQMGPLGRRTGCGSGRQARTTRNRLDLLEGRVRELEGHLPPE